MIYYLIDTAGRFITKFGGKSYSPDGALKFKTYDEAEKNLSVGLSVVGI